MGIITCILWPFRVFRGSCLSSCVLYFANRYPRFGCPVVPETLLRKFHCRKFRGQPRRYPPLMWPAKVMVVKLTITTYRDGTLSSHSQQQIRSALEGKLGRGIRHPAFVKLIEEAAAAAAKAVAAEAPRYLRIDQIHQTHQAVNAVTPEALHCLRIHQMHRKEP